MLKKTWLIFVAAITLLSGMSGFAKAESIRCINSAPGTCLVPIFSIYAHDPDAYHNNIVVTVGYVRKADGLYLLLPVRETSHLLVPEQAIVLVDSDGAFNEELAKVTGNFARVEGTLSAAKSGDFWAQLRLFKAPEVAALTDG